MIGCVVEKTPIDQAQVPRPVTVSSIATVLWIQRIMDIMQEFSGAWICGGHAPNYPNKENQKFDDDDDKDQVPYTSIY